MATYIFKHITQLYLQHTVTYSSLKILFKKYSIYFSESSKTGA